MYKNFFNPYKHAVDLAIFNEILLTPTFTGTEVNSKSYKNNFTNFEDS
jgi:hypothetical protein